ncbi:MAG TPA: AI-2E family transporter [Terriglobales bacterium]|nr:AI-2E family transporter [Terriglobales bacterium]
MAHPSVSQQRIVLGTMLGVQLLLLFWFAWPFVSAFLLAGVIAIVLHPANERTSRRLRRPGLASLLTTLAVFVVMWSTVSLFGVRLVKDAVRLQEAVKQQSQGGGNKITAATDRVLDALAARLPVPRETIREQLISGVKVGGTYLLGKIREGFAGATSALITVLLATFFLYYLLRYGAGWVRHVAALSPLSPGVTDNLLRTARDSIVANVNGVFVVALAQGVCLTLAFWFVEVSSPLLWGFFGGVASIIPLVGAPLVWAPMAIWLAMAGSYWKAIGLALWGSLFVGSLDNILRPLVVGKRVKMNPVLVGFSMLGGTFAIGPIGLLAGPLLVAMTQAVVEELQRMTPAGESAPGGVIAAVSRSVKGD